LSAQGSVGKRATYSCVVLAGNALGAFEIAQDNLEQVVEVMRDASGNSADDFQLLRLP